MTTNKPTVQPKVKEHCEGCPNCGLGVCHIEHQKGQARYYHCTSKKEECKCTSTFEVNYQCPKHGVPKPKEEEWSDWEKRFDKEISKYVADKIMPENEEAAKILVKVIKSFLAQQIKRERVKIGKFISKMECHSVPKDHSDSNGFCHYGSACGDIDRFLDQLGERE